MVHGNPFDDPDDNLVHLISKMIMNEEAVVSVKRAKDLGERQFPQYVEKRLIKCEVSIHEKIEKNKLVLFRAKNKVCSSESGFIKTREKPICLTVCGMPVARL